jgi:hypothetical protein
MSRSNLGKSLENRNVEQRHYSSHSAKSSSGASKSGDIQCFVSLAVPGRHGQLVRATLVTMAFGSPWSVSSISSPGTIPSTIWRRDPIATSNGNLRGIFRLQGHAMIRGEPPSSCNLSRLFAVSSLNISADPTNILP